MLNEQNYQLFPFLSGAEKADSFAVSFELDSFSHNIIIED
jgi:hypothetical protein